MVQVLSAAADFSLELSRVIVNEHVAITATSTMLTIEHERGTLTLTPDHVLLADGAYKPAAAVRVGALLEPTSKVTKVTRTRGGIINPVTANGLILAAGPTGAPVSSLRQRHPHRLTAHGFASPLPLLSLDSLYPPPPVLLPPLLAPLPHT